MTSAASRGDAETWTRYLDRFHTDHAGVTEAVFYRLELDGVAAADWIVDRLGDRGSVLEVACGSAPLWSRIRDTWVGVDRSRAELALAQERGAEPLVCANATALPVAPRRFDTVLCSMGLMLFRPVERAVAELARVTRAEGRLVVVLPDTRPLTLRDRVRYTRLLVALRRRRFDYPNDPGRLDRALARGGFDVVASERRRFRYRVDGPEQARLLVDSLYLPGTDPAHIRRAAAVTQRWIGTSVGVPLRRVVATRRP